MSIPIHKNEDSEVNTEPDNSIGASIDSELVNSIKSEEDLNGKETDKKESSKPSSASSIRSYDSLDIIKKKSPLSWSSIFWSCAINIFLPFVNGLMLGFGEIFAHELGFRWGWSAARVSPASRMEIPKKNKNENLRF